jgi:hypothetical protein
MKTKLSLFAMLLILSLLDVNGQAARWKFLGERAVNDRIDHDIIMVTAARGDMNALQIRVKGAPVDFHRVVVVYGNGRRQEIELRNTIPARGASRVIDLIGDERVVKSVEFWYDANTLRGRKAIVRLFGRD